MKKLFTFIALILGVNLVAQPLGWQYKSNITVHENSNTLVTNYQLKLTVNTQSLIAAAQMNANGNDIRFGKTCNGSVLFNYWIESGINTTTTTIWVKIDTLQPSATKTIYMFYGNSAATAVSAVMGTFIGPNSSTDSVSGGAPGGTTNSQRGFRFQPTQNLLVTDFGKNEPTGSTRYVTLFDNATQAVLTQTQVGGPAAQYTYNPIQSPIWLTTGTQYVIELYQGASDGYYYGSSSQVGQHLTYIDMLYCNSCTQNTFPTNSLPGYQYGYPDFLYYIKNETTPIPTFTISNVTPLNVTSTSTAVCSGSSATLTASGATTYTWSTAANTASISVTPTASSVYTVTGTLLACNNSNTISLNVNPSPTVTAVSNVSLICTGQSATLTANGAATYSWNTSATTTVIVVSPTVSTTYTVTGTSNNCPAMAIITQSVSACTNLIANTNEEKLFKIIPNPNTGEFVFEANNIKDKSTIEVYNTVGQLVYKTEVSNGHNYINIKHLSSGMYYINIKDQAEQPHKLSFIKN